jgi:hypothetical protein
MLQIRAPHIHCYSQWVFSEAFIQGKVTKRLRVNFPVPAGPFRGGCQGKLKGRFPGPTGIKESTQGLRAAGIHPPQSHPSFTPCTLPWTGMGDTAQTTSNLQRFLVLPSLAGAASVVGFGQQDGQRYQEAQKQNGTHSDDKRHIPRR